jgi:hypothetical protein
MNGIVLDGIEATAERQRLLKDGKEIAVALRERDATGKKKASWFQFGSNGAVAWVFYRIEGDGCMPRVMLEEVLAHEASELFGGYFERMMIRKGLVDPSPLSAEFVEICPCIEDVMEDLKAEFDIKVGSRI